MQPYDPMLDARLNELRAAARRNEATPVRSAPHQIRPTPQPQPEPNLVRGMGIYQITHVQTDRVYIGSSTNITRRRKQHWNQLNRGSHHCWKLQQDWLAYGSQGFTFESIEECAYDRLHIREEYHIRRVPRRKLYNTLRSVPPRAGVYRPPRRTGPFRYGPCCGSLAGLAFLVIVGFGAALALGFRRSQEWS